MSEQRFHDFYAFDYGKLVAALAFVTGDGDLARDAVDEACARASERLGRGDEIDVLAAWIRVVALNVARGRLRRLSTERRARARIAANATGTSLDTGGDAAAAIDLHAALAALSRRQREVVVMHYFLDQTVETIAAELEIPTGTVKSALNRARAVLARVLADAAMPTAKEQR